MAIKYECEGCGKKLGLRTVGMGETLLCDDCKATKLELAQAVPTTEGPMKKCPSCGGEIPDEARKCRHCFASVVSAIPAQENRLPEVSKKYGSARFIFGLINILSWVCAFLAIPTFSVETLLLGASGIATSQLGLILIDTEYNTRESAAYLKQILWDSWEKKS